MVQWGEIRVLQHGCPGSRSGALGLRKLVKQEEIWILLRGDEPNGPGTLQPVIEQAAEHRHVVIRRLGLCRLIPVVAPHGLQIGALGLQEGQEGVIPLQDSPESVKILPIVDAQGFRLPGLLRGAGLRGLFVTDLRRGPEELRAAQDQSAGGSHAQNAQQHLPQSAPEKLTAGSGGHLDGSLGQDLRANGLRFRTGKDRLLGQGPQQTEASQCGEPAQLHALALQAAQPCLQLFSGVVELRLDGALGDVQAAGNLRGAELIVIEELHGKLLRLVQLPQQLPDDPGGLRAVQADLRGGLRPGVGHLFRDGAVLQLGKEQRLSASKLIFGLMDSGADEPGLKTGRVLQPVQPGKGGHIGLLGQILGSLFVPDQAEDGAIGALTGVGIEVRHGIPVPLHCAFHQIGDLFILLHGRLPSAPAISCLWGFCLLVTSGGQKVQGF